MTVAFDTLTFSKKLVDAGMTREVSEALSSAIQDIAMNDIATKGDLETLKSDIVHSLTVRGFAGLTALGGILLGAFSLIK